MPCQHPLPSNNSNLVIARGRMVGGLSVLQLFIFIPLFSPSQEGLSSPLLILLYSVKTLVVGAITQGWDLRMPSSQALGGWDRTGGEGLCPWHPALECCLPLCRWCPAWLILRCLVLRSEVSGRELIRSSKGTWGHHLLSEHFLLEGGLATGGWNLHRLNSSSSLMLWGACLPGSKQKKQPPPTPLNGNLLF